MTHPRRYALLTLAAVVISLTAAVAWQWEPIAYVDSGQRLYVVKWPDEKDVRWWPLPDPSPCYVYHSKPGDADYRAFAEVPRDGNRYEVARFGRRWNWLPTGEFRVKVLRQIPRGELNR